MERDRGRLVCNENKKWRFTFVCLFIYLLFERPFAELALLLQCSRTSQLTRSSPEHELSLRAGGFRGGTTFLRTVLFTLALLGGEKIDKGVNAGGLPQVIQAVCCLVRGISSRDNSAYL